MVERPRAAVAQVWNEAPEGTPVGTSTEPEHRTLSPVDARGNGLAGSPRLLRQLGTTTWHWYQTWDGQWCAFTTWTST